MTEAETVRLVESLDIGSGPQARHLQTTRMGSAVVVLDAEGGVSDLAAWLIR